MSERESTSALAATLFLSYLAIGGVLGDIGTSPLYVMSLCFKRLPVTRANVMGVLSLITWSFVFLSTKYAWMALNMDNEGEGGTFALLNLIRKEGRRLKDNGRSLLIAHLVSAAGILSMVCGALLLSDGVITPSISVLAAVEGVEVLYPHLAHYVVPLAVIILTGLFLIQKRGTEKVAKLFSPIVLFWFATIAFVGLMNIRRDPSLIRALSPHYAVMFLFSYPLAIVFPILGYVVLCITGGEALYADEAHYSKHAIRLAWAVASLCLLANYFGQGAYILTSPKATNPFFDMAVVFGHRFYLYLLLLATLAAIVASQAMISGSFSTYKQAMELRMFPRLEVRNTSSAARGQIYIPWVNVGLFTACLATVFIFRRADALGDAYGLAVTGAFIGTTLMMSVLWFLRHKEVKRQILVLLPVFVVFLLFDSGFFFSNLGKIPTGGWFPLIIGTILVITMVAWEKGSLLVYRNIPKRDSASFLNMVEQMELTRVTGTDIHMTASAKSIAASLIGECANGAIRETVVLVTVRNTEHPWGVQYHKQLIGTFHEGRGSIYQVIIEKGYMRLFVNVPNIMDELGFKEEPRRFVFGMWNLIIVEQTWKKWLLRYFRIIYRNSPSLTERFMIPSQFVAYVGGDLEISF
ncbi:MAG: KUP/HAK/KT family potassium transporter [Deltaproteobacteria bacterium]|nr:KUP/HAK/KT family potassium transporter [Deltaproteobacteria bacterium]